MVNYSHKPCWILLRPFLSSLATRGPCLLLGTGLFKGHSTLLLVFLLLETRTACSMVFNTMLAGQTRALGRLVLKLVGRHGQMHLTRHLPMTTAATTSSDHQVQKLHGMAACPHLDTATSPCSTSKMMMASRGYHRDPGRRILVRMDGNTQNAKPHKPRMRLTLCLDG
jgi:hypothetical protein